MLGPSDHTASIYLSASSTGVLIQFVIENWVPTNSPTKDLLGLVPGSPPFAGISVCSHQPHLPPAFSSRPFPARDAHYTVSLPAHLICSRPPKSFLICHTLPKKLVVWRFHMLRGSLTACAPRLQARYKGRHETQSVQATHSQRPVALLARALT